MSLKHHLLSQHFRCPYLGSKRVMLHLCTEAGFAGIDSSSIVVIEVARLCLSFRIFCYLNLVLCFLEQALLGWWPCCCPGFQSSACLGYPASLLQLGSFGFLPCIAVQWWTGCVVGCCSCHPSLNSVELFGFELISQLLADFFELVPIHSRWLASRCHLRLAFHSRKKLGMDKAKGCFRRPVSSSCSCPHHIRTKMVFLVCPGFQ